MPLRLVRSDTNAALWTACSESFLNAVGDVAGPTGYPDFLLLTHRVQRDVLMETAAARSITGWLNPPVAFFSDLRGMFGIEARPVGILTGRMLVARLAGQVALSSGVRTAGRDQGPAGTHMLDRVFSELLPEGVTPEQLREALVPLAVDEFSRKRNAWVADTYEAFLSELAERQLYDPRSIHAMVARRIETGGLLEAIGGAKRLHVLGVTSLRARQRLFRALSEQEEVEVRVYLPLEEEPSEWEDLATGGTEVVGSGEEERRAPVVQPAPDSVREATWVARRVKRLLAEGGAEPHEVAVVARSGHRDTRIVHAALEQVGVPATARLRSVLAEIPVLKALLQLLRAEADGWTFERLRQVLASPYFSPGIDLRPIDVLASTRRYEGLAAWREGVERLAREMGGEEGKRWRRKGISGGRLSADLPGLLEFFDTVGILAGARAEGEWIDLTLQLLAGERFDLRERLCVPVGDRWDIVRLDQRGVEHVVRLLREWSELVRSAEPMSPSDWYERLRRLLEANELALSTPLKEGVQVLEAHEASLSPFRYTFVVHANDGIFPRAPTSQGVFSDEERLRLRELGLPLTDRSEAMRRERTLWRSVTHGENVTLTYRTTDSNGVPRLPSLMVPEHDPGTELPRTLDLEAGAETGAATAADLTPVSPAQQRRADALTLKAARRAGQRGDFHTAFPEDIRRGVLGAFADELRSGGLDDFVRREADLGSGVEPESEGEPRAEEVFGIDRPISLRPTAWNGRLRDPALLAELGRTFGPEYTWSASQLEKYGKRPFDFLLERVLGLEEVAEAEEETSVLTFGTAAHAILEGFYAAVLEDVPAELDERAAQVLEEVGHRVIAGLENNHEEWLGLQPLWEVTREDVREKVRAYLAWELKHMATKGERPIAVELQFGFAGQPPVELAGLDVSGEPVRMRLRGKVDRVDRYGDKGGVLRVLDYKSGLSSLPRQKGYQDGALLQTALYMMAVDSLALGPVDSARYRGIGQPGNPANKFELKMSRAETTVRLALSMPGRIRAGLFEPVQAASAPIARWQPGRDVTRNEASLGDGTRFDRLSE